MQKKSFIIVLFLSLFLSGCHTVKKFTDDQTVLNYKLEEPKKNIYQVKRSQKIGVYASEKRDYIDGPNVIVNKVNTSIFSDSSDSYYTGKKYLAEKPVINIVLVALIDGLRQMNIQPADANDSRYVFGCTIQRTDLILENNSTLILQMINVCILVDTEKQKVLWKESIISRGSAPMVVFEEADDVAKAFNDALTKFVRKIQDSPTLQITLDSLQASN